VYGEKSDYGEPDAPHGHLTNILQVEHAKYENKFEKYEIPKLIFDML
jgi:hypothetical protein